jgi:hypothetical protein
MTIAGDDDFSAPRGLLQKARQLVLGGSDVDGCGLRFQPSHLSKNHTGFGTIGGILRIP